MIDRRSQLGEYAGFFSRLIAVAIDIAIIALISFALLAGIQFILNTFGFACVTNQADACSESTLPSFYRSVAIFLERFGLFFAALYTPFLTTTYALFFWAHTGQTPGKAQMGVRIVRMNGEMMNWQTAFRRLLGYGLSIATLFGGFAWILVDEQRRGLHDRFAGTCVLYSWDARPDERFLVETLRSLRRDSAE